MIIKEMIDEIRNIDKQIANDSSFMSKSFIDFLHNRRKQIAKNMNDENKHNVQQLREAQRWKASLNPNDPDYSWVKERINYLLCEIKDYRNFLRGIDYE